MSSEFAFFVPSPFDRYFVCSAEYSLTHTFLLLSVSLVLAGPSWSVGCAKKIQMQRHQCC